MHDLTCNFEDNSVHWIQLEDGERLVTDPVCEGRPAFERSLRFEVVNGVDAEAVVPGVELL